MRFSAMQPERIKIQQKNILRVGSKITISYIANFGINVLTYHSNESAPPFQESQRAMASQRFCINRKIAPSLSIEAFFRLVNPGLRYTPRTKARRQTRRHCANGSKSSGEYREDYLAGETIKNAPFLLQEGGA
jgi:hypothetical protein